VSIETVFIAIGVAVMFVLGVRQPTRSIIPLYAALIPIGGVFRLPVPLPSPFNTLSSLIGGIAILATMVHIVFRGRARIPSLAVAAWLMFFSWTIMTAFWAQRPTATFAELQIALPLVLLMVVVGFLPASWDDVSAVRLAIVLGGAAVGGYALVLLMAGSSLPLQGFTERFSIATDPSQTNPNQLAAALLLPLILSVDLVIWGRGPRLRPSVWKVVGALSSLLISVALILTGSRGGVIAAGIGFTLVLVFAWRWHPQVRRSVVHLVAGALLTVALLGFVSYVAVQLSPEGRWANLASIDPLRRLTNTDAGSSGRAEIWTTGYLACKQYCTLGAGLGNFPTVFTELFANSGAGRNVGLDRPGHNLYIQVAVETGFVGLTLLGFAIVTEWRALRSTGSLAPALAASLVALLVVDGFESFLWFKYFWLFFLFNRLAERASFARVGSSIAARTGELRPAARFGAHDHAAVI
jgi:O-antigen ligase